MDIIHRANIDIINNAIVLRPVCPRTIPILPIGPNELETIRLAW
jgi:hypothetical protein